jgi:hypothetical protein
MGTAKFDHSIMERIRDGYITEDEADNLEQETRTSIEELSKKHHLSPCIVGPLLAEGVGLMETGSHGPDNKMEALW